MRQKVLKTPPRSDWLNKLFGRYICPRQSAFLAPNLMFPRQTRITKRIFFFYHTTPLDVVEGERLTNTLDSCRCCQPFQRRWAVDLERVCRGCENLSEDFWARAFKMASVAPSWPRPRVYGRWHQGHKIATWRGDTEIHRDQAIVERLNLGWTTVRASICCRNAPARGSAVYQMGQKAAQSCFICFE